MTLKNRITVIGTGRFPVAWIGNRGNSPTRWHVAFKPPENGAKRQFKSLHVQCSQEEAIELVKTMYSNWKRGLGFVHSKSEKMKKGFNIIESLSNLIDDTYLLGVWELMSDELCEYVREQKNQGGYVYVMFPSDKKPNLNHNDMHRLYNNPNILRGKIGCSGIGKDNFKSLHNRIHTYRMQIRGNGKSQKWNQWMNEVELSDSEKWYVVIYNMKPEDYSNRVGDATFMEQAFIYTCWTRFRKLPVGNRAEATNHHD
jgi:hypothetical protein